MKPNRMSWLAGARIMTPPKKKRKLKRPDGEVVEEFVVAARHLFEGGECILHYNDLDGDYTGRICFRYPNGRMTRWHTRKSAPKWLRALWEEATMPR